MEHQLKPADRVEVTILVDNYTEMFVPQSTPVDRPCQDPGAFW